MIHVSFTTINRQETYINESINSCLKNSTVPVKINVYSGTENISYIKVKDFIHQISCLSDQRYNRGIRNQTANYIKALIDTQLIFEDDIIFEPKWNERFQKIKDDFKHMTNYFVTLYNPYHDSVDDEYNLFDITQRTYWGAQGIYYPNSYGIKFSSYLANNIGKNHVDNSLGIFSKLNNYRIYFLKKSLVQHIGKTSAYPENGWHQSHTF